MKKLRLVVLTLILIGRRGMYRSGSPAGRHGAATAADRHAPAHGG